MLLYLLKYRNLIGGYLQKNLTDWSSLSLRIVLIFAQLTANSRISLFRAPYLCTVAAPGLRIWGSI